MLAPDLRRPYILAAVMAGSFMIAIEATIVSTAMPQIVSHLGGLRLYSWVFASFLLAQTATTVVFGKLSDLYGRKPVLLVGTAVFLVGSVLCGFAWSMPSLIAFRLIQGLGAGAVQPVSLTVIGDLYPGAERGRVQGWLASVWGLSSVVGPLAGGLIIQHFHWGWVFWINVPLGLASALGFFLFLHERVEHEERSVDAAGAGLFAVGIAALMVSLTDAGHSALVTYLPLAIFVACTILFLLQERRARDPMVAVGLWTHRPIATANATALFSGMALIGLTTFLPMYVQAVMDRSALVAGFTLTVMVLGWPVSATLATRNFHRFGLRTTQLAGAVLLPIGALAFILLRPGMSPMVAGAGSLVMGFGMGLLSVSSIVIIQESVEWAERGVATASNIFARNLGSTLGATVLGAVLNISLSRAGASVTPESIRGLIDHRPGVTIDAGAHAALAYGLHLTFWGVVVAAVLTLVAATLVPPVEFAGKKG